MLWYKYYHIARKFGGNYIWRNGLQMAQKKKLNLAFGLFESPHMVHGRVSTRELCLKPSHTHKNTWTPLLGEVLQCKIECGNVKDHSMPTPEAYSHCTCLVD